MRRRNLAATQPINDKKAVAVPTEPQPVEQVQFTPGTDQRTDIVGCLKPAQNRKSLASYASDSALFTQS